MTGSSCPDTVPVGTHFFLQFEESLLTAKMEAMGDEEVGERV
jgi:hypothetical protein